MKGFVAPAVLLVLLLCGVAHGHGVSYGLFPENAVAVRFVYSGDEPMSYVAVKVFGPQSEPDLEFQNGRTDARGVFAFVPDGPGEWMIEARDESGHRGAMRMTLPKGGSGAAQAAAQGPAGSMSTPLRALLGLSLLANVALAGVVARRRAGRLAGGASQ